MSYQVKQGNIFGRVGQQAGKGLSEQLPEEVQRYRLSQGLKDLESNSENLSPFQQYAKLASIPGITPQMIQSGAELLKNQSVRNAYQQRRNPELGQNILPPGKEQDFANIKFANLPEKTNQTRPERNLQRQENAINEPGQPQISERNPLRQEAVPPKPWTPEQRDADIAKVFEQNPYLTLPEAIQRSADNEARYMAQPSAERAQDEYFKGVESDLENEFTKQMETKLQKSGEGVFKDVTGEMINNMKREMSRELRTTPEANIKDIANKWSNKALDLAKTKSILDKEANSNLFATPLLLDKNKLLDKLKSFQKIFHETGNDEEFYNNLKEKFTMSPQGAASIAFPLNKNLSKYVGSTKQGSMHQPLTNTANAKKRAVEIEDKLTAGDSLLAIARALKMKDIYFSEKDFFNQLREDQDNLPLTSRQQRELTEGASDFLPSWGDILILPFFRGI